MKGKTKQPEQNCMKIKHERRGEFQKSFSNVERNLIVIVVVRANRLYWLLTGVEKAATRVYLGR